MAKQATSNQLVRYSRAGDAFHYRWAARRSLRLIDPYSTLESITIEGSKEKKSAGEYVIDLAEYSQNSSQKSVSYFQLKHSTTRTSKPFARSELTTTLKGFAGRYSALYRKPKQKPQPGSASFVFVSNRPISGALKHAVAANARGVTTTPHSQKYLEKTTGLRGHHLQAFCASLSFQDDEEDYIVQKERLSGELSEYIAGFVKSTDVDALIAMIADRALPSSQSGTANGDIRREDVFQRLGVHSERDLFPAPLELEKIDHTIHREQHDALLSQVISASSSTIVHAAGGVGKSVVARQLAESLPKGSQGFIYDCFGGGKYRNPSEPRHRASDALTQLANEMAARGLCRPLISSASMPADAIFRAFGERLKQASQCLQEVESNGLLVLIVDAADNAEMAAEEYGEKCFAHLLLRETLPRGCRLVMFCRTERVSLLKPQTNKGLFELHPFSKAETAAYLRTAYPDAIDSDCLEFHRLTGGNPRVQANALSHSTDVGNVLSKLDPDQNTVDGQIASQLENAIATIKHQHVNDKQIDSICRGLANLPPFVPLAVLAQAADVDISAIRSFISDLGRPLWHTDDAVQFRDEPTETWFRAKFSASKTQVAAFVDALEPLAKQYPYVAKVLPQLLLRSESYDRLFGLALSDELLPEDSPIDQRDIRLYRLQFAFKAALKLARYSDAAHLAIRAGEEAAGSDRQLSVLQSNLDLIALLQSPQRIQELAYRRAFQSGWDGSANLFSGSLLSSVEDFHGEARTYLRASDRWLHIYIREREKQEEKEKAQHLPHDQIQDTDIAEFCWAMLNLRGAKAAAKYALSWRPPDVAFRAGRLVVRRLVDAGRFAEIDQLAVAGIKSIYLLLAVADELLVVGRHPPKQTLSAALRLLTATKTRIPKAQAFAFKDDITPAILSLAEASTSRGLSRKSILSVLRHYLPFVANRTIGGHVEKEARRTFFRGVTLRAILTNEEKVSPDSLLPPKTPNKAGKLSNGLSKADEEDIIQIIKAMLPWYLLRARLFSPNFIATSTDLDTAKESSNVGLRNRYHRSDTLPWEVARVSSDVLILNSRTAANDVEALASHLRSEQHLWLDDRIMIVRAAFRLEHLTEVRASLELACRAQIESYRGEGPEDRAHSLTALARAVLPLSTSDAAAYFDQAIEAVSKFGDEMVERWESLVAVARRVAEGGRATAELTYRFVRCAEVVGDTVAREKYWDRDDVFRVAIRLDPSSAIAALSRWRDRRIGWFDHQLNALAREAVASGAITSRVAWCLSGFEGCNASSTFTSLCIEHESDKSRQQAILEEAIRDEDLAGTSVESLSLLQDAARTKQLKTSHIDEIVRKYESIATERVHSANLNYGFASADRREQLSRTYLEGLNLLTSEGLELARQRFRNGKPPFDSEVFWHEIINQIPPGKERVFLAATLGRTHFDVYDMLSLVAALRQRWLPKAAVQSAWNAFIRETGKLLAPGLLHHGTNLGYFSRQTGLSSSEFESLKTGVMEGIAGSPELISAGAFFGFVRNFSDHLTTTEAISLLEFSLQRFESHIEDDVGDELWDEWLIPPADAPAAVIGLLWSALGSPYSETRWEAAHAVRRLIGICTDQEIALLIDRMQNAQVGCFGSHRFPFYELHAKLYLLIALSRAAIDHPAALAAHAETFKQLALDAPPHILIQKYAANIALSIQKAKPKIFSQKTVKELQLVGQSSLPIKFTRKYGNHNATPWHAVGEIDLSLKLEFGYDFDRYWLAPLGEVFGVSENSTIELARDTAIHSLKIPDTDGYSQDPRQAQWEASARRNGTYGTLHDHGDLPRIDDFTFYNSYHAHLSTAARLLKKMPVVRSSSDYVKNRWDDWLASHMLARNDGRWLSDRRDPTPLQRPSWTRSQENEDWEWRISAGDFSLMLRQFNTQPDSLCVSGHWTECEGSRMETVYIASALVKRVDAESIARSLRDSDESYGSAIPRIGDEGSMPLTSWILPASERDRRLDTFDPYARNIRYAPQEIGAKYASLLELSPDSEHREWRLPNATTSSLRCEVWSDERNDNSDRPFRSGERIQATIDLLRKLCRKTRKELLFEVRIERRIADRHSSQSNREYGYVGPSRKIFILSSDGLLREKTLAINLLSSDS